MEVRPVTLEGRFVRLEPLADRHVEELWAAGADPSIWTYMAVTPTSLEDMRQIIASALEQQARGSQLPFAVIERTSGRAIGSTRYLDIRPRERGLEIGWTWYGIPWQGTVVNSECKLLLLRHAFEDLGCVRVCLKTDARNLRSQRAIERLGAVREGVLRKHMLAQHGVMRDTVYYSILDEEWPTLRLRAVMAEVYERAGDEERARVAAPVGRAPRG